MTSSASQHDPLAMWPAVRISDPGDLLAAVPALLGFPPQRSLVLVCVGGPAGTTIGPVVRVDLVLPGELSPINQGGDDFEPFVWGRFDSLTAPVLASIDQLGELCARERVHHAIALIVDDRIESLIGPDLGPGPLFDNVNFGGDFCGDFDGEICGDAFDDPAEDGRDDDFDIGEVYEEIADALGAGLAAHGTILVGAHITMEIAAGEFWWSLLGDRRTGFLRDPGSSTAAATNVLHGRQIRGSRAEVAAVLEPGDPLERIEVAKLIADAAEAAFSARRRAARAGTKDAHSRNELVRVLFQVENVATGAVLGPAEIVELGVALTNVDVRDCALVLATGDQADAAEQLWLTMVRLLPDPYYADAAALLGYSCYVRGDGPLAGIAFEAARRSEPGHRLANLLDGALQNGVSPQVMRSLADTSYAVAKRLGVILPPPRHD
ncbi:DUF4192 domain-containing protein [Antrihabitans sp. YC3-6]|uniref:DUF4192 domain-containing protein n=1 Tax=Antrihabitans stalagmiti TaxID=2799499 RepID=A0A934NTW5_9NOCA|nr:DUF4192 domain-containing protein [Antrihabitans stalagmiti]MBJ8341426.1 DUF4192 domain-containing protein [Antrihabitans stalagmiti]